MLTALPPRDFCTGYFDHHRTIALSLVEDRRTKKIVRRSLLGISSHALFKRLYEHFMICKAVFKLTNAFITLKNHLSFVARLFSRSQDGSRTRLVTP